MQQATFDALLDEIYAAFGRSRPALGTPQYRSLWRRVNNDELGIYLPDKCAKSVAYAICDYDSMPSNLGRAIHAEYQHWLEKHPEMRAAKRQEEQASYCGHCIDGTVYAYTDPKLPAIGYKCRCNRSTDPAWDNAVVWDDRLIAKGIIPAWPTPNQQALIARYQAGKTQPAQTPRPEPMQTHMQGLMADMVKAREDAWLDF